MPFRSHSNFTLEEAVETLSTIAELDIEHYPILSESDELSIMDQRLGFRAIEWLDEPDRKKKVGIIREIFRIVVDYLNEFYIREGGVVADENVVENIKSIMILVGEAAKKLDKYTKLFHKKQKTSVFELKEYKQLQDFYQSKIAKKIDTSTLGKWILGLSFGKYFNVHEPSTTQLMGEEISPLRPEIQHLYIDLEGVKRDSDYELFFIKKENGSRFFNPKLIRNMKLSCDFGSYIEEKKEIRPGEPKESDPLENLTLWIDHNCNNYAKNIVRALKTEINHFYHILRQQSPSDISSEMTKCLLALSLASQTHNLKRYNFNKSCQNYFQDFLIYLRSTCQTATYNKWLAYPTEDPNHPAFQFLNFIHKICYELHTKNLFLEEISGIISNLIDQSKTNISPEHELEANQSHTIWSHVAADYIGMKKLMKRHPNGPLVKILDSLNDSDYIQPYDPLLQQNYPIFEFVIAPKNQKFISVIRIPAPISQETIQKATVTEEFKNFIRNHSLDELGLKEKHLMINLEDRTSWLEFARSSALEELQYQPDMRDHLRVATFFIDTDFYEQIGAYQNMNHAHEFIQALEEQFRNESNGFYLPNTLEKKEILNFIQHACKCIHRICFTNKNVLLREHRINFIDLLTLLLSIKLINVVQPTSLSFTCKNGFDVSILFSAKLYLFLKMMDAHEWTHQDHLFLNTILYGPILTVRERLLLEEPMQRFISTVKTLETLQHEYGLRNFSKIMKEAFFGYLDQTIFESTVISTIKKQ